MTARFEPRLARNENWSADEERNWHPLSRTQRGLWLAYRLHPELQGHFNLQLTMRTRPAIEPRVLESALETLAARHPMLRARFAESGGEPRQFVVEAALAPIEVVEVESIDASDVAARVRADHSHAIDVTSLPPWRTTLYRAGTAESVLCIAVDHLVADGWSLFQLTQELGELLEAGDVEHTRSPFNAKSFFDYVEHERTWLDGKRASKQLGYWRDTLANVDPSLELRPDRPGANGYAEHTSLATVVPSELYDAVREFSVRQGVTPFVTLLAAYSALLHRLTGQEEVSIGSVMPTRGDSFRDTLGNFVNRVVMPSRLHGQVTVAEQLQATQSLAYRTLRNKDYPFDALLEALNPARAGGLNPYFRAFFVFQKARHAENMTAIFSSCEGQGSTRWGGLEVEPFGRHVPSGAEGQELTLETIELPRGLYAAWAYDARRFDRLTIERFAQVWIELLRSMVAAPDAPVLSLPWLGESERERVLCAFNDTAAEYARERCIHELFEAHAHRAPDGLAVQFGDLTLSYAELNARANQLAHRLRALGVGPESRVGVAMERGLPLIVAILATWKAGGAYVPLDPAYPVDRLGYMLRDCAPQVVLVDERTRALVAGLGANAVVFPDNASDSQANLERAAGPRNAAYVIYTSGSTGTPKGVVNEHRGLSNLATAQEVFEVGPGSHVLQFASPSFDASVWEVVMALAHGASLHLAPRGELMPGRALLGTLARHDITHVTLPPSALALCEDDELAFTPSTVIVAGEAIAPNIANAWAARVALWNAYGPTEATVCATVHRCLPDSGASHVSIGRPIANAAVYVLDANREPVPVGVAAEIYVGGMPVARGYLNREALTAERFTDDPFRAGERLYRTGDLGRWHSDGTLQFLGRVDSQIKLRGYRIELGEIEARLAEVEGVAEAAVIVREHASGEEALVAYYTGAAVPAPDVVRESLAAVLPEYMVPAACLRCAEFERTPNGKLNRAALPAPDQNAYRSRGYEAPRGEVEAKLAALWEEVLQRPRVGRNDNFFELGGSSLLAVRLLDAARHAGLQLHVRSLFASRSLAELAETVAERGSDEVRALARIPLAATGVTPEMLPLVRLDQAAIDRLVAKTPGGVANLQDIYPLTPLQEGILLQHRLSSAGDGYVVPAVLKLGDLDVVDRYLMALQAVIDRHDILRTAFAWEGLDEPVQIVARAATLDVEDFALTPAGGSLDEQLRARFDPRLYRIDVERAPVLRAVRVRDEVSQRWSLVLVMHHLLGDHTTLQLVLDEAEAVLRGDAASLPPSGPFRDFVAHVRAARASESDAFFRALLADVDAPLAPFGITEVGTDAVFEEHVRVLPPALASALQAAALRLGLSRASIFQLAWALVLARVSDRTDVVFGTVLLGRTYAGGASAAGLFVNTLPSRIGLEGRSVWECLQAVQAQLAELLENESASLAAAQRCSGVAPGTSLITSLFNYRSGSGARQRSYELQLLSGEGGASYPLTLCIDDAEALSLTVRAVEAISPALVAEMVETAVTNLVAALERDSSAGALSIEVLPDAERCRVLADFNATAADYPLDLCVHELFEAQVERSPHAIALIASDEKLTYGELNARANQLAAHLRSLGVGPDRLVAVCLERRVELVVALLGILKAGGAYVPLEPSLPRARLQDLLEDCKPHVLLVHGAQSSSALSREYAAPLSSAAPSPARPSGRVEADADQWPDESGTYARDPERDADEHRGVLRARVRLVDLGLDHELWANAPATNVRVPELHSRHLAYVIYTSGSTGRPKGAMNEHRGVVNRLIWTHRALGVDDSEIVLQKTPFSFDVSVPEFFGTLSAGATLVLARPGGHRETGYLADVIQREQVTSVHFVPSMLQAFLADQNADKCTSLRRLICSGEALPANLARRVHELLPGVALYNLYGPTEAAVDVTAWRVHPGFDRPRVPIGRPIANTQIYVLDHGLQPVPVGAIGALYIGGVQVGRGYLEDPQRTAAQFIDDPFVPGGRLYETGDLARWLPDGSLEYLGRTDFQVKVRGVRIELGEIEAALSDVHGISELVVSAREDLPGDQRLVAYYIGTVSSSELRRHASAHLPEALVPTAYVQLDRLPLSANGKLDRRRLPAPGDIAFATRLYEAPFGESEVALASVWADVLGRSQVGRNDSFFELGGHSLSAVTMIERLRVRGYQVPIRALFTGATLAELASLVTAAEPVRDAPSNLIPLNASRITPQMLSLVELTQPAIDSIVEQTPGGAANVQDVYPLTAMQEGMLFHHLIASERGLAAGETSSEDVHLAPAVLSFGTRAALDLFVSALQQIIDRHDILRTSFAWQGLPEPVQVVQRSAAFSLHQIENAEDCDALELLKARFHAGDTRVDLHVAPLLRGLAVEDRRRGRSLLLLSLHHLVGDKASLDAMLAEAEVITRGEVHRLPPAVPFRDFVANILVRKRDANHEAFFRDLLGDVTEPTLPFGLAHTRTAHEQRESRARLSEALSRELREVSSTHGVTTATLLHFAWALVLARLSGRDDVVFGTVLSGRMHSGAAQALGMFIHTLPMRLALEGRTVTQSLRDTHGILSQLVAHEHASLALAQRCSGLGSQPLFSALFNYRRSSEADAETTLRDARVLWLNERTSYPLALSIDDRGGALELTAQVEAAHSADAVCAMLETCLVALAHALRHEPETRSLDIEVMPELERQRLTCEWNATARAFPQERCFHELFESQVDANPGQIAVTTHAAAISYSELNLRANQLARYLRTLGVGPDQRVALCLERGLTLVIATLATWKAGGAIVPLDPSYPKERLDYVLRDCAPVALLVEGTIPLDVGAIPRVDVALSAGDWAHADASNLSRAELGLRADHLAYVIYTSGSTGRPKGVMNEHRGLVNLVCWQAAHLGADASSRVLQFASPSFDASLWELGMAFGVGATLHVTDREALTPGRTLHETLAKNRITHVTLPPSVLSLCDRDAWPEVTRSVIVAGEAIRLNEANAWATRVRLWNGYGPTETAICATAHRCEPDARSVPIGRPIDNAAVYVLNARRQLVPAGVAGEIYIGGAGVARGYLNLDALTAERFGANPFEPGQRLYRSGDVGRWLADGTLEYLGRRDHQVKLRGFRIELGEIEARLASVEGLTELVACVREDAPSDPRVVVYYAGVAEPSALRARAVETLPSFMVPAAYVQLERFALTPNGKIDRAALPAPSDAAFATQGYEAPRGEIEVALASIWADVLQRGQIGRNDNFFELGGHSLSAVTVIERMRERGFHVPLRILLTSATLAELARAVRSAERIDREALPPNLIPDRAERITPQMLPLVALEQSAIDAIVARVPGGAASVQDIYPLTATQQGMLFHHLVALDSEDRRGVEGEADDAYLTPAVLSFGSRGDLDLFVTLLQQIIDRHDILRTSFAWEGLAEPVQVVQRTAAFSLQPIAAALDRDVLEQLKERFRAGAAAIDLRRAPLLRGLVAEDARHGRWLLLIASHHIIGDQTTFDLMLTEARAISRGELGQIPRPVPFRNVVAHDRARDREAGHESFFCELLADVTEPTLPFGLTHTRTAQVHAEARTRLSASLSHEIRAVSHSLGVTTASTLHLAWALVLARLSCRDDVVFGTVLSGRMQADAANALGMLIHTLPLRLRLEGRTVAQSLRETHAVVSQLVEHEHASLALAQRCSQLGSQPLFSAVFNYRRGDAQADFGKLQLARADHTLFEAEVLWVGERTTYPMAVFVDDRGPELELTAQVASGHSPAVICAMLETCLTELVAALAHSPATDVLSVEVLPESERRRVLCDFNATAADYPLDLCVHELFEAQVARTPDAVALSAGDVQLTYRELNARANKLAAHLRLLGVGPDRLVAVCMERSLELVVGLLAILKAGGAYVPLEPALPRARLEQLLDDCKPLAVLFHAPTRDSVRELERPSELAMIDAAEERASLPDTNVRVPELHSRHLAYVIYTSGSTGVPKGAMNEHRAVVNRLVWTHRELGVDGTEIVLQKTPYSFDVSVPEFFGTLSCGAKLVLARPDGHREAAYLADVIRHEQVSSVHFVPSMLQAFLADLSARECSSVRRLICSGEALPAALARRVHELLPHARLYNLYGPTEAAVDVTAQRVEPGFESAHVPIGRPIANTQLYVLDHRLRPIPVGAIGELYIGGVQVGRGYLERPQLTAAQFIDDPFTPGARSYRTGDLGRWLPDGNLEYLGRTDFQVKVRGVRIELGEIEAVLSALDGISEVVVTAREDSPGDLRLVAYYVGAAGRSRLRAHANAKLPEALVPAAYVQLPELPLSTNGKLDRRALPAPGDTAFVSRGYEAPRGAIEVALASSWAEVLERGQVGRNDNFFELGGHSLSAVSVMVQMRSRGFHVPIRTLFTSATLADLARAVTRVEAAGGEVPANLIPSDADRVTPQMLPLVALTQPAIDSIVDRVPGGAANVQDIYPLTAMQEGILLHHRLSRGPDDGSELEDVYLTPAVLNFPTRSELDAFVRALQQIIERHDILRTSFAWHGLPEPVQVVQRRAAFSLQVIESTGCDALAELKERFRAGDAAPDLHAAPLLRGLAVEDAHYGRWLCLISLHHLIDDKASLELMVAEARAITRGELEQLRPPVPFRNFVARIRSRDRAADQAAFFRELLGDVTEPTLPFGLAHTRTAHSQREARARLSESLSRRIREVSSAHGVSTASLLHLAWALVLARVSARNDVVFGTVLSGRMQAEAEHALGVFIHTLPMRLALDGRTVEQSLREAHALLSQLVEHEHASLAVAQRCSGLGAQPLFSALFNYRRWNKAAPTTESEAEVLWSSERTSYPLGVIIDDREGELELTAQLAAEHSPAAICAMLETCLSELVEALAQRPESSVLDIEVMPELERDRIAREWTSTARAFPAERCVHQLFELQAARNPDHVAVAFRDAAISYRELNARANQLARHLRALGVGPDDRVALCLERSISLVVATLATWKAGGAIVPLDPAYPSERLEYMLHDCAPAALLVDDASALDPRGTARVHVERDAGDWARADTHDLSSDDVGVRPEHLAYIIYTSGSTGRPKGVMNEHRGLTNLVCAQSAHYGVDRASRVLQFVSPSFDVSLGDLGMALIAGATLQLADREALVPGGALLDTLRRDRITHVSLPASVLPLCDRERWPDSTHTVIVGGESLRTSEANTWAARVKLFNAYGPTEAAVCATTHRCLPDAPNVPIGRPIDNVSIYVLNAQHQLVPVGAAGEIYIGGAGVARGYLNLDRLTSERFIANPFERGARLYRTGDLGRWRTDGTLEFLGRRDHQVKVRGFRIELGEIEARLASTEGVTELIACVREDEPGDARVVVYYVGSPDASALRSRAVEVLPEFMVPAAYVRLDGFARTPNGKIDRTALPRPESGAYVSRAYEPPEGEIEVALASTWLEVLQREQVGRNDNFFELGGHSLSAVAVMERMRACGFEVPIGALFTSATLAELALAVSRSERSERDVPPNLIPDDATCITPQMLPLVKLEQVAIDSIVARVRGGAANVQDIYPLTAMQEGMLFQHLLARHPEAGAAESDDVYLTPAILSFRNRSELDAFVALLQQIIDRHDSLRTSFAWEGLAEPVQVVQRTAAFSLQCVESACDPVDQLKRHFQAGAAAVDLREAPLMRGLATEDAREGRWLLLVASHHILGDQQTLELLLTEAHAIARGALDQLPPPVPFRSLIAQVRANERDSAHEAFFRELLGDVTEPTLPFGLSHARAPKMQHEASRHLGEPLSREIRATSRALGVTTASLFHFAWALVLARLSSRDDVVFGTVLSGRMQGDATRALGILIHTLPMRVALDGRTVAQSLRDAHTLLSRLAEHEHASLALAQRCAGLGSQPLFAALFNYRRWNEGDASLAQDQLASQPEVLWVGQRTSYPLGMSVDDRAGDFELTAQVVDEHSPAAICAMLEACLSALTAALRTQPETLALDIEILPASERQHLARDWNDTARAFPRERCFHELFESQAAANPDQIAVVFGSTAVSYRDLNARANQLARHLRALGVGPDARVAVCLERGLSLVIAMLAIWKAGGAIVPLDPRYPKDRLDFMLRDCTPVVLLVDGAVPFDLRATQCIDIRRDSAEWSHADASNLSASEIGLRAEHLAYVIYTSGSTGRPKGVMNEHRGLVNLVCWQAEQLGVDASSRVLQFASPSFDASLWELGMALGTGASLHIADREALAPGRALLQTLANHRITHVTLPPSVLSLCDRDTWPEVTQTVIVAGESIRPNEASAWAARVRLWNGYGPTEAAVCATAHRCLPEAQRVPIGRPIDNVAVYVLNARQQLVPAGVAGELYIGGASVARGYLNLDELTSERFIASPFEPGARLYRTGDVGRWLADGTLEFLGRRDHQVKVRGFRIELGEIEARLASVEGVTDLIACVREDEPGDARVVVYYVGSADSSALRSRAVEVLPEFMVPAAYVQLERFVLTANGKIDRAKLPRPELSAYASRGYEAPEGALEQALSEIWGNLLGLERIGRHADFFELGGHSLTAVQLIASVRRELQVDVPLRDVFSHRTLAAFASAVTLAQTRTGSELPPNLVPLRTTGNLRPLFGVHPAGGTVEYLRLLAATLDPRLPLYGIEASGWNGDDDAIAPMAEYVARYLDAVRAVQGAGPYRLIGYSAGGLVAYAMAEALIRDGEAVEFVGIIDSRADLGVAPEFVERIEACERIERDEGAAAADLWFLRTLLRAELPASAREALDREPALDFSETLAVLRELGAKAVPVAALDDEASARRAIRIMRASQSMLHGYRPMPLPIAPTVFVASESPRASELIASWHVALGDVFESVHIGGTHITAVEAPHVHGLAAAIAAALNL